MKLENSFTVPAPPEKAWPLLLDVERIAPCLPGATLTEVIDPQTFKGKATVKVGPVALAFDGTAKLVDIDHDARTARLQAKGADTKGRGGAEAEARFALTPADGGTQVTVTTDLAMSGGVAQYGRASGLMQEIANQLVGQFATNLAAELARDTAPAAGAAPAPRPAPQPAPQANAVSGLSLLFASLMAMLRRWFGGSGNRG